MDAEFNLHIHNGTWTLAWRPQDRNLFTCKYIYMIKEEKKSDGSLCTRNKARLVAHGFSQVDEVNSSETYAPVVNFTSVPDFLALVAVNDFLLHHMDVVTAFLNGELKEGIFM